MSSMLEGMVVGFGRSKDVNLVIFDERCLVLRMVLSSLR